MMKIFFLLFSLSVISCAYGGTKCPEREKIYPCICLDRKIGKSKYDTTLICRALPSARSLLNFEPMLSDMEINKFLLYDSYWNDDRRRAADNARVPVNILSGYKIEEVEIVDTDFKTFACPDSFNCGTNYLKRLTAINSTLPERSERSNCRNSGLTEWAGCVVELEYVMIKGAYKSEMTLKPEFFPEVMRKLKHLHLPYNGISKIDTGTFTDERFPVLDTLDLSHNSLRDGKYILTSALKVKHLDLSHNSLRTLVDFQLLPHLKSLKLNDNRLVTLLENEWKKIPGSLRHIDISNNGIQCSCQMKWINATFHMNANLVGDCAAPREVANKNLRRASRLLNERCTGDGKISDRKIAKQE